MCSGHLLSVCPLPSAEWEPHWSNSGSHLSGSIWETPKCGLHAESCLILCGHLIGDIANFKIFFPINSPVLCSYLELISHLETYIISSFKNNSGLFWPYFILLTLPGVDYVRKIVWAAPWDNCETVLAFVPLRTFGLGLWNVRSRRVRAILARGLLISALSQR